MTEAVNGVTTKPICYRIWALCGAALEGLNRPCHRGDANHMALFLLLTAVLVTLFLGQVDRSPEMHSRIIALYVYTMECQSQ